MSDSPSSGDRPTGPFDLGETPLLEVTRAEIEAYNELHGLAPRFDQSNLDTTYFRNWLRLTFPNRWKMSSPHRWLTIRPRKSLSPT